MKRFEKELWREVMTKNFGFIIAVVFQSCMGLFLAGCGIGTDGGSDYKAQQVRDAKALEDRYDRVRGSYEGNIVPADGSASLKARLMLYVQPIRDGNNADGTPKIRPGLFGRLDLVDSFAETDQLIMAGDFDDFGNLEMTSGSNGPSGAVLVLSIKGQSIDGRASLEVRSRGTWGRFEGTRVTLDAQAPDASVQRYDRIRGTYEGVLKQVNGARDLNAKVFIYTQSVQDGINPDGTPKVRVGLFSRLELKDAVSETDLYTMTGEYDESGILQMTSTESAEALSVSGQVGSDQLSIEVRRRGVWGRFEGRRTSIQADAPVAGDTAFMRDRLNALFAKMDGVYRGVIDAPGGRQPISITLLVAQSTTGLPVLNGQFRYEDLSEGTGERQLRVEYNSTTDEITMDSVLGSGSVPGSNFLSIKGTWVSGRLEVTIYNHRGLLGTLRANRVPF